MKNFITLFFVFLFGLYNACTNQKIKDNFVSQPFILAKENDYNVFNATRGILPDSLKKVINGNIEVGLRLSSGGSIIGIDLKQMVIIRSIDNYPLVNYDSESGIKELEKLNFEKYSKILLSAVLRLRFVSYIASDNKIRYFILKLPLR